MRDLSLKRIRRAPDDNLSDGRQVTSVKGGIVNRLDPVQALEREIAVGCNDDGGYKRTFLVLVPILNSCVSAGLAQQS